MPLQFTETPQRNRSLNFALSPRGFSVNFIQSTRTIATSASSSLAQASQAEAEAGSISGKYMSPVRVAQALDGGQLSAIFTDLIVRASGSSSTLQTNRSDAHGSAQTISQWASYGKDSAGNDTAYGFVSVVCDDSTNGSEDSSFYWYTFVAGSQTNTLRLDSSSLSVLHTTEATSTTTGALAVAGGASFVKDVYVGGIGHFKNTAESSSTGAGFWIDDVTEAEEWLVGGGGSGVFRILSLTAGANLFQIAMNATATDSLSSFVGSVGLSGSLRRSVPVTETAATHILAATTTHLICNRSSTITVTLGSPLNGRELYIKNTDGTATVVSASSNVVPRAGGSAGTAILAAVDGAWAFLVGDGTNWVIMAGS